MPCASIIFLCPVVLAAGVVAKQRNHHARLAVHSDVGLENNEDKTNPFGKFLHVFDWSNQDDKFDVEAIGTQTKSNSNTTAIVTNNTADTSHTMNSSNTAFDSDVPLKTNDFAKKSVNPISRMWKAASNVVAGGANSVARDKAAQAIEDRMEKATSRGVSVFTRTRGQDASHSTEKDSRVQKMHVAAWKQNLTFSSSKAKKRRRTQATCQIGAASCKSFCRWLKLTDKDFNYNSELPSGGNYSMCPLLDWSMESCGYVSPESRASRNTEPVDCVVDFMRRNVQKDDVVPYVEELEECMLGLPRADAVRYTVPLEMLTDRINDWKTEQSVRAAATDVQARLQRAISNGKAAFESQKHEQQVAAELSEVMKEAESITGHYLIDDIRTARELLDKIQPHLSLHKEMKNGVRLGISALQTRSSSDMLEALVWLNVSISNAEQLGVNSPPEALLTRNKILTVQAAGEQLRTAVFQANVSYDTKMDVPLAILKLNQSIHDAIDANVSDRMPVAREMVRKLVKIQRVAIALQDAINLGRMRLNTNKPEEEGIADFSEAIDHLNRTIVPARFLGLDDQVVEATKVLKGLKDVKKAGKALHSAIATGRDVLLNSTAIVSDNNEEEAAAILAATIPWAQNSGLTHGMPIAKALLGQLRRVEKAKEHMALAIAKANASLSAKAGETDAINDLLSAIRVEQRLNLTAGIVGAKRDIKRLRATQLAREDLSDMVEKARLRLNARSVHSRDVSDLNASIAEASRWGLRREVEVATSQLDRLDALLEAQADLEGAMASASPHRAIPHFAKVNQTRAQENISEFDRTALQVVDLPEVPGSHDDGDRDFEEHIQRLNRSIAKAKSMGLVDPDMLVQLGQLQELQVVWNNMQVAVSSGEVAVNNKLGLTEATVELEAAIEEAQDAGLSAGVQRARQTLKKLQEIPPLRDELDAAMLQANISLSLMTGMHEGLMRLNAVIDHAKALHLVGKIPKAELLRDRLMVVNEAWLHLRAASVQGTVALRLEHGEEAAIQELTSSIHEAEAAGLHAETPTAVELLQELMHMNAEHQQIQAAVVPNRAR